MYIPAGRRAVSCEGTRSVELSALLAVTKLQETADFGKFLVDIKHPKLTGLKFLINLEHKKLPVLVSFKFLLLLIVKNINFNLNI